VPDAEGSAIRAELAVHFRRPPDAPLPDDELDALARRIFAYQFARNAPYGAFCRSRGVTPAVLASWRDIPAVPTAAFKEVDLVAGDAAAAAAVFRTSGTTQGRRGRHVILDLSLYHGALLPNFRAYVVPDLAEPRMLALVPPPQQLADSSLSHMIAVVMDRLGARGSGWYASVSDGIDEGGLEDALARSSAEEEPVVLLGTSFAFVHWTDSLRARGRTFSLPPGSRIMDTGGYKGRGREVAEDALRAAYGELLGIEPHWCVNEYGMTELCSQFYDATVREHVAGAAAGERRKVPPPWVRTLIVDPDTLAPLPDGRAGLLRHIDLANLGSVIAVQTEDIGERVGDGFRLLGRSPGAQPRGCSLAMDELLRATRPGG
jgi:hypothetical protein